MKNFGFTSVVVVVLAMIALLTIMSSFKDRSKDVDIPRPYIAKVFADTVFVDVFTQTYGNRAVVTFHGDTIMQVSPLADSIGAIQAFRDRMQRYLGRDILIYYTQRNRPEWAITTPALIWNNHAYDSTQIDWMIRSHIGTNANLDSFFKSLFDSTLKTKEPTK